MCVFPVYNFHNIVLKEQTYTLIQIYFLLLLSNSRSSVIESGVNHLVDVQDEILIPDLWAGSSKDLEDLRCSRLGCQKFGETFLTASELEKHEGYVFLLLCETSHHLTASQLFMLSIIALQLLCLTNIQDSARSG